MTRVATPLATVPSSPADLLWRTYDDAGWQLLGQNNYHKAKCYFAMAQKQAADFPTGDYRLGRTLAGLSWSEYWLAREDEDHADPDDFRRLLPQAESAVKLLNLDTVERRDRPFRGRAYHILGLIQIELCQGAAADDSLTAAGRLYRASELINVHFDVLHYLGKLKQCRRKFAEAVVLFRQVVEGANSIEKKFAALVDLANTLTWMGYVREAKQLEAVWQELETKLKILPDEERPHDLLFRGQLLFARVNSLYGDFVTAAAILETARQRLCACPEISDMCRVAYWIVSAELALHRGDLICAWECLSKATLSDELHDLTSGFNCLDIIAIDVACRRCVVQSCTYECVSRRCIFRRRACRIVFTKTTTEIVHTPFKQLIEAVKQGLRGQLFFNAGRFAAAARELTASRSAIEQHLHPQSPLLLNLLLAQAELAEAQMKPEADVTKLLQQAIAIGIALDASLHPLQAARAQLLAHLRVRLSHYEAATALYLESLKHAAAFRLAEHPTSEFVLIQSAVAEGIALLGDCDPCQKEFGEKLLQLQETIHKGLARLSQSLGCDDYRHLLGRTYTTWLCFAAGAGKIGNTPFDRLVTQWEQRDERLNQGLARPDQGKLMGRDPRQGLSKLGSIAALLEQGTIKCPDYEKKSPNQPPDPFKDYEQLMRKHAGLDGPQIAIELNRIAELLCRACLECAAKCFSAKADSLCVEPPGSNVVVSPSDTRPAPVQYHQRFPLLRRLRRR